MSRRFTFWQKKRGSRRTGSQLWGGIGEGLFFAALVLIGTVAVATLVTTQVLQAVEGAATMSGWTLSLFILIAVLFIGFGGGGLLRTTVQVGTSAERRTALAQKAADIELLRESKPQSKQYPNIPYDGDLTNSPGIMLSYRLPIDASPIWRFLGFAGLWICTVGLASMLVAWAWTGMGAQSGDMTRVSVSTLFVLIAIVTTYFFVRTLLIQISLGPTIVEISDHPLHPDHCYQVFLSQSGHLTLKWLQMRLICEEEATYEQGTDIRTEIRPVCSHQVFRKAEFQINPGRPFEEEFELRIPEEAMHSFNSTSNSIHWKLVVRGEAVGWPQFHRTFPIIIFPCKSN